MFNVQCSKFKVFTEIEPACRRQGVCFCRRKGERFFTKIYDFSQDLGFQSLPSPSLPRDGSTFPCLREGAFLLPFIKWIVA